MAAMNKTRKSESEAIHRQIKRNLDDLGERPARLTESTDTYLVNRYLSVYDVTAGQGYDPAGWPEP
jgi:hypothetical protein